MATTTPTKRPSRKAARAFADKWAQQKTEKQLAQSFWMDFFHQIIGVDDLLATGVEFEHPVKSATTGTTNFIDVLWPGVVLAEHKSAGKNLDVAETQARDYLISLPPKKRPPVIIISDFATFRIVEVLAGKSIDFQLTDLPNHLDRIDAIFTAYGRNAAVEEITADTKAVKLMADLYVAFEKSNYPEHQVSVFLVRVLFLLFGDDTQMWKKDLFRDLIRESNETGAGLGGQIQELFQTLNSPKEKRPTTLDEAFTNFPWVNGGLFKEPLPIFSFTEQMRSALVKACNYDWAQISPAIFGSMFQTIKSKEDRRALGEHYTSEANILKVIRPLFLDDFLSRLRKSWDSPADLRRLRADLGKNNFLDPAAGSGNFLVMTYKRLRDIEHKIIARLIELEGKVSQTGKEGVLGIQTQLDGTYGLQVKLEQFHAIEYEEWSSQIATVAMFLTDHQANLALDELTGAAPNRFPLTHAAVIRHGNALRIDWSEVCPMDDNTIIMGNPPFNGSTNLNAEQQEDQQLVWGGISGTGVLDYVASWYLVAARHLEGTNGQAAFVSTNSITQGQQPAVIWGQLEKHGMGIDFAHRTFGWTNEAARNAAVHVVIMGISARPKPTTRSLWSYETLRGEPTLVAVKNINPYLLNAASVLIRNRRSPLQPTTQVVRAGNKPADGKWLSNISPAVAEEIRNTDPIAAKYLRRVIGSEEFIQDIERYGLWLVDADPNDIANSPVLKHRIEKVREMREASPKPETKEDAKRAKEWQETIRQPKHHYLVIPAVSSEDRDYVPMGILPPEILVNNLVSYLPEANLTTFGILMSRTFNVWNRAVSGRMKSDPRISVEITYNNFPFPTMDEVATKRVENAAQKIITTRENYPNTSLAALYGRNSMPTDLQNAHIELDKAVLNAYGLRSNHSDIAILEDLFTRYAELTQGLLAPERKKKRARKPKVEPENTEELSFALQGDGQTFNG